MQPSHGKQPVNEEDMLLDNFYNKKQNERQMYVSAVPVRQAPMMHFHMDVGSVYMPPEPMTLPKKSDASLQEFI
jgi:hypothetical protein